MLVKIGLLIASPALVFLTIASILLIGRYIRQRWFDPHSETIEYAWALMLGQPLLWKEKNGAYKLDSSGIVLTFVGEAVMFSVYGKAIPVNDYWRRRLLKARIEFDKLMEIYNINKGHPRAGTPEFLKNKVDA